MYNFPIGVLLDCFKTDIDTAIKKAVSVGAQGIQIYATSGELAPDNLTGAKRAEFLDKVNSAGLTIAALCGDLGHGFGDPAKNPELIEKSKRILELAKELGTNVVTTHIGVVPGDPSHERYKIMQQACNTLSEFANNLGGYFAIETGPETSAVLKTFLDSLAVKGVGVNMDPANLIMVTGDDPVQAVHTLKDYIVHTHAKDGVKNYDKDPEIIYGLKQHSVEEEIAKGDAFAEVPLGQGGVDFPNYLRALEQIAYTGFLTIEREVGDNPEADIELAVEFLRGIIGKA